MKTIKQVAQEFCVSEMTVRRWIDSGKLNPIKIGRTVRIPAEQVEELKKENM